MRIDIPENTGNDMPSLRNKENAIGFKADNVFTPGLKIYITTENCSDCTSATQIITAPSTHAVNAGFEYQQGQFNLNAKTATSFNHFEQDMRVGHSTAIDSTFRLATVKLYGGLQDTGLSPFDLPQGMTPGTSESHIGADWAVTPWLTLNAEHRRSQTSTASLLSAPFFSVPITATTGTTTTQVLTKKANIDFGAELPGWGLTLQNAQTLDIDVQGLVTPSSNYLSTLRYNVDKWNGTVSIAQGHVAGASLQLDTRTHGWQFQLGREFSWAMVDALADWNAKASLSASQQTQYVVNTGLPTQTIDYGLNLSLQRASSFQLNTSITHSMITQPLGGPGQESIGIQLDGSYPLRRTRSATSGTFKAYVRDNVRNIGEPNLRTRESVVGLQLNYPM